MATSISRLPTIVYRTNLIAAYNLRAGLPQTPISRYMGMSMTSQKT